MIRPDIRVKHSSVKHSSVKDDLERITPADYKNKRLQGYKKMTVIMNGLVLYYINQ